MRIRKGHVALGLLTIAIVSLAVVGSIQGTQQRELMERAFVTLGRFPDAVAVYKLHEERRISETYVTRHTADEIRAYYDQRLHEMGWQGPGAEWTAGVWTVRCYVDRTGEVSVIVSTQPVPSSGNPAYGIEISRNGCTQDQQ